MVVHKSNNQKINLRLILEVIGLVLIIVGVYSGRNILVESFGLIVKAKVLPLILALAITWLNFVWSSLGYKLLIKEPIKTKRIMLAHLAAAGIGRIIPGGGGHASIGTLFLTKNGLSMPRALSVSLTNNITGLLVNSILIFGLFVVRPRLFFGVHVSAVTVAIILLSALAFTMLFRYFNRFKKVSRFSKQLKNGFLLQAKSLASNPLKLAMLISIMLLTIITNSMVLLLSAQAAGVGLSIFTACIVTSLGVAAGSLLPTPSGIGGVEAGLIGGLYASGMALNNATATALIFRLATYVQPLIPGVFAYLYLRRKKLI